MPPLLWADFPVQYLVPLVFFVIWIVNQIFGQDGKAKSLARREVARPPARPSRGPMAPPARPDEPRMSWGDRVESGTSRPPATTPRDEFLVIAPERTPKRPANKQGRGKPKQQSKSRQVAETIPELRANSIPEIASPPAPESVSASGMPVGQSSPQLASLLGSIQDPARVREAIILNELLRPPVALRGRPPGILARSTGWAEPQPTIPEASPSRD